MFEVNTIKIIFSFMTFFIVFFGLLLNKFEKYLPIFIVRSLRYGKFAAKGRDQGIIKSIDVPKSWFRHFYVFSSILSIITLCFVLGSYVLNIPVPFWLRKVVDIIGHTSKNRGMFGNYISIKLIKLKCLFTETAGATLLAIVLLTTQCVRRLYDTHFVSVYGPRSRMNLSHYLVGYIHYLGAIFAILVEAPNFTLSSK